MASTTSIQGKVVAITGGARGIGLATATALTSRGARVAIGDIDEVTLKEAATELGLSAYAKLDVTDEDSFAHFLDYVEETLGPIDVLVNNAGIMPVGRLVDEPAAVTRRILDINVLGVVTGSKLAARRMVPRRRGHIINVASLAGEIYAPGVDFSLVMPSFVNTELTAGTHGIAGVKNAEPTDIAAAIVGLIVKPRPRVRATRLAGALSAGQKFVPRRVAEALNRALGGDSVFTDDVDVDKRMSYEDRARHD
jgi:hypothetical protein